MKPNGLALLGGTPVYNGAWPTWPRVLQIDNLLNRFSAVLNSTHWTIRAPGEDLSRVEEFERAWAARCKSEFALAVTSGSSALDVALKTLGAGPGDEIIVPAMGWYATAAAVNRSGATPVFADVDPRTTCIDVTDVRRLLTSRTAGVIAVHLHCAIADLDALSAFTTAHDLWLIEDAAQAHGGVYRDRPVGGIGNIGCFSFNQEKMLAAGEGGAIVTQDADLYRRAFALRTDGYQPLSDSRRKLEIDGTVPGNNFCLSELHAALLLHQLETFDEEIRTRENHRTELLAALAQIPGVAPIETAPGTTVAPCYEFGLFRQRNSFGNWPLSLIAKALSAELQTDIHPTDVPGQSCAQLGPQAPASVPVNAAYIYEKLLVFHHRHLLSSEIVTALPAALQKVHRVAETHSASQIFAELDGAIVVI